MFYKSLIIIFIIIAQPSHGWRQRWYRHVEQWVIGNWRWHYGPAFTLSDWMGTHEKQTIMKLMEELMKSSEMKFRQVIEIRAISEVSIGFNVGLLVGKVRDQYRTMLDMYREAIDLKTDRLYFKPPGVRATMYQHYYHYLEYIHRHEKIIDEYIHVIEMIPESEFDEKNIVVSQIIMDPHAAHRRQEELDKAAMADLIAEERLKQKIREEYLMKRLGMPTNMSTPKKRFQNQWPVRRTWEENFDKMY